MVEIDTATDLWFYNFNQFLNGFRATSFVENIDLCSEKMQLAVNSINETVYNNSLEENVTNAEKVFDITE